MHEKLHHLSEQEVEKLVRDYYDGKKVSDLITEFRIDVLPSKLVSLFPPTIHEDNYCPYCDSENFVTKAVSRNSYSAPSPTCPQCKHEDVYHCRCKNCQAVIKWQEQNEEDHKKSIIFNQYYVDYPECKSVEELTLTDALYLLSVVRHSASEDLKYVHPFASEVPELAPIYELTNDIVKHLYGKGFLHICYESDVNAFVFDDDTEETTAYYPTKVAWLLLPSKTLNDKKDYMKSLEKVVKSGDWPAEWQKDVSVLWLKITKYECIEYLLYSAEKRNLPIEKIGEKTHSIFENVLESYSVGQVFNLIFQSAMSTNDYAVRENIPRYRAKNMFIGSIQRKADKAEAEGWTVKNSRRDFNCPQTVVSTTFFDTLLGLGGKSLESVLPKQTSD